MARRLMSDDTRIVAVQTAKVAARRRSMEMAQVQTPVEDDKIIAFLESNRGFSVGAGQVEAVEVRSLPPASNSDVSHVISVTVRYGAKLGEVQALAGL